MNFGTILRSPLVHFFLLGGLVFAFYGLVTPPEDRSQADDVLRLSQDDLNRLADGFAATWGRPPTKAESRGLVRDWIIEEVMVREALALGLDKGDAMIRNRLRAKMEFLAEASVAALQPDEKTLLSFYEENAARYARPSRISFAQVLLPPDADSGQVDSLLTELAGGGDPTKIGQATMLPPRMDDMPAPAIERVFGDGFDEAVAALPVGKWSGPVVSGYGHHLVQIGALKEGDLPPFESLREKVLADWRLAEARKLRMAFTDELLAGYKLELPGEIADQKP